MGGVLGLGLAALGRPGYMTLSHAEDVPSTDSEAMQTQAFSVLDVAYARGFRHVDTARSYGKAEAFLAAWLDARKPVGVTVTSKWGYRYTAEWQRDARLHEVKDHSVAHLDSQWEESRALLGGRLDGYQIHSATLESGVLRDEAVLDRLAQLKAGGVAVGLSATGPRQPEVIDTAMAIRRDGLRLFDWVQATWNVLEPSSGAALQRAKDAGARVIIKEGMANGRLSPRGQIAPWLDLARSHGVGADALALAVILQQPFVDVVLSGAATVAQLVSNLAARQVSLAGVEWQRFAEAAPQYWSDRARLTWT